MYLFVELVQLWTVAYWHLENTINWSYVFYGYVVRSTSRNILPLKDNGSEILTWIWLFLLPGAGSLIGILIVSSQFVTTIDRRALYSVCICQKNKQPNLIISMFTERFFFGFRRSAVFLKLKNVQLNDNADQWGKKTFWCPEKLLVIKLHIDQRQNFQKFNIPSCRFFN